MAAEKILCVLAGYDEKTEASLAALQNTLYENGFTGTQTKNIPQHITLGTFSPGEEPTLRRRVTQAAEKHAPFPVSFNHIGLFGGAKVLFAAPDVSRELLALKERFGDAAGWTAHSTLLIDEPEAIYRALPIAMARFRAFSGTVRQLYLYEFWPARLILSLPLKGQDADTLS